MSHILKRKCWSCGKIVNDDFNMILSLDRQCCSIECAKKSCISRIKIETLELLRLEELRK